MMTCFICWILNGGPTQWIGLPVVTTPSFRALILDFTNPALKLWTLSPRTGREKIIGSIRVSQIGRVITSMRECKAIGTLVIPMWKSSYFWILLCDDGKHWNAFVHDWVILPKFGHLFIRGKAKNHVFGSKDLSFSVVALRLNLSNLGRSLFCVFVQSKMTIARFATIFIIRVFGTHLWRSLWVLRLFTFFRNVVFELVHAFACFRDWSFPLLMIVLLVCQLPFGSSFSSGRFYFS